MNLTELVFIVDKSGSMAGLQEDTIGGYNSMLKKQKELDGECLITTVFFNHNIQLVCDRINIKAVNEITEKEYLVGGATSFLDAMGFSISKIINVFRNSAKEFHSSKVLFVIITDGEENSSKTYSSKEIKKMIERQKEKYGWEFIFLGANMDAVEMAGNVGINKNRAQVYLCDREGIDLNYTVISETIQTFRKRSVIEENWSQSIQENVKSRQ